MSKSLERRASRGIDIALVLRLLPILLVAALAFLLRVDDLRQPLVDQFAWREANTAMVADNLRLGTFNPFWAEVSWTGDRPGFQGRELQLYTLAVAIIDSILGWADWHGRALSVISGTATTIALYGLVRRLAGERQALGSAGIYAVLPGAVLIDRSYLPDPLMLLLLVGGLWVMAESLVRDSRVLSAAAWTLLTLAALTKITALAALPAALYLAVAGRRPWLVRDHLLAVERAVTVSLLVVIAYYAFAVYVGRSYPPFQTAGYGWIFVTGWRAAWDAGFHLPAFAWHAQNWLWGGSALVLAALGTLHGIGGHPGNPRDAAALDAPWFFHAWLLGGVLFLLVGGHEPVTGVWNLHVLSPMAAALAAGTLVRLARGSAGRLGAAAGLAGLVLTMAMIVHDGRDDIGGMKRGTVGPDHALGRRLAAVSCPGELVVTASGNAGSPVAILYSRRKGFLWPAVDQVEEGDAGRFGPDGAAAIADLAELVDRGARWFGIVRAGTDSSSPPAVFETHYPGLLDHLRRSAVLVEETPEYLVYDLAPLGGRERDCPAG